METLSKLFGSLDRVKILKLFIFNPGEVYSAAEAAEKAKISPKEARKEIALLQSSGVLKRKMARKNLAGRRLVSGGRGGYSLDPDFHYLSGFRNLLGSFDAKSFKAVEEKLQKAGRLKLLVLSGFFIQDLDSRVDLLVVGDHINRKKMENAVKTIESEVGRELRYSIFETPEFQYRMSIYDRLVRDILDYPHRKVLNKLGI